MPASSPVSLESAIARRGAAARRWNERGRILCEWLFAPSPLPLTLSFHPEAHDNRRPQLCRLRRDRALVAFCALLSPAHEPVRS